MTPLQQQRRQISSNQTPHLSPPATKMPRSRPPRLQGAPPASPIPHTPSPHPTLSQWRQQAPAQQTPHPSSLRTLVPAHLSPQQEASPGPGPLSGLRLQLPALTPPSPPSLPHTQAQRSANTPRATPRAVLRPTHPPTATAATATQPGPRIPILSRQRGDPSTDQDMEFHSRTHESTTAPLSQFVPTLLSHLFLFPPCLLHPNSLSSSCLFTFSTLPLPFSHVERGLSLYLSLLHYFSLSLNISLLISPSFSLSFSLSPPTPPTLVSGCYVVFKC